MSMNNRFEIPYNFDKEYFELFDKLHISYNRISSIYMIPFPQDYETAWRAHDYQLIIHSWTREEYESHIALVREHFYGKMMLLLQQPNIYLTDEQLEYYLALGFTKFCVGSIEQAKRIKEKNSKLYVISSITMKIMPEDIEKNFDEYKKYLNGIVLYFKYNKKCSLLETLPKDFDYILLANCWCHTHCPGTPHWIYGDDSGCPMAKYIGKGVDIPFDETSLIRPTDLSLFEPYIHSFKLQGRECQTWKLFQEIIIYMYSDLFEIGKEKQWPMDYDIYKPRQGEK